MANLILLTRSLGAGRNLTTDEVRGAATALASEEPSDEAKAGFLSALSRKGETSAEVAGFALVFRELAIDPGMAEWSPQSVDIVGTGGDHAGGFNVSSMVNLVVACAGVPVMKHGNRGITSKCGSADLFAALGVNLEAPPAAVTLLLLLTYLGAYFGLVYFLAVRTSALTWRDIASPRHLAPSSDDWGSSEPSPGWTRSWGAAVGSVRSQISRGHRLGDVLIAAAMVVPLMLASNVLSAGLVFVLGLRVDDISNGQVVSTDGLSMLLTFLTVAIVAPVGEEVFFRGFAANAWGRSLSHNSAIVRASLFFAFIHIMNTPASDPSMAWRVAVFNFGARVPVAFALTWVYMRRRSILASGTLHAGYNGLITILSFL